MPTYNEKIIIRVEFESSYAMHIDMCENIRTMYMSLAGVHEVVQVDSNTWRIHVGYGTYVTYIPEDYLRMIDTTRQDLEASNEVYTNNKAAFESL